MAAISNRSRFTVSVKHRPDLYREFRFNNKRAAELSTPLRGLEC